MKKTPLFLYLSIILNFLLAFQSSQGAASNVYLKSSDFSISEEQKIAEIFSNKTQISVDEFNVLLEAFIKNKNTENYYMAYSDLFFSFFRIEDILDWRMQNMKHLRGAYDYVTDPPDGSDPLWETTNRKLRSNQKLSLRESNFVSNLNLSFTFLPKFQGIVFRGSELPKEVFLNYQKGKVVQDPAFVSTSINPQIAQKFSQSTDATRISVIFVILVNEGVPVSVFHEYHWEEKEVLLKNGQKFEVIQTAKTNNSAVVFMKQL